MRVGSPAGAARGQSADDKGGERDQAQARYAAHKARYRLTDTRALVTENGSTRVVLTDSNACTRGVFRMN